MNKFKSGIFLSMMIVSMSVGIMASVTMIAIEKLTVLPFLMMLIFGSLVTAIVAGLAFLPALLKLREITIALHALNNNKHVELIDEIPLNILSDITRETNQLLQNQVDFQSMRGRLYQQISEVAAQEERNRLARDFHDSIKQQVFSMSVSAAAAHAHLEENPLAAREALLDVRQSAQEAMVEMRVLLQQLAPAPLEQSGLVESMRQQMEALSYRTGAKIETEFDKLPSDEHLPIGAQETLFRIAQEALSNIARHARAKHVSLTLKHQPDTALLLTITDDGQGFDMTQVKRGMGLNNIEQRLAECRGEFSCDSAIGKGTILSISIPLSPEGDVETIKVSREQNKKNAEKVHHRFMGVTLAFSLTIFTLALMVRAFVNSNQVVVAGIMGIISIVAAIGTWYVWRAYQGKRDAIMPTIPEGDPALHIIQQNRLQALWIIALACGFVIPGTFVGIENYLWVPTLIGGIIFLLNFWLIGRILFVQQDFMLSLLPFEMAEALRGYRVTLSSGIAATVFAALAILLPGAGSSSFYLMPSNHDQWESNFFTGMMLTFVIYYLFAIGHYWYWTKKHNQQSETQT